MLRLVFEPRENYPKLLALNYAILTLCLFLSPSWVAFPLSLLKVRMQ